MNETWKPVKNYEDCYEVSDAGRVRRTKGGKRTYAGRILIPAIVHGYERVWLNSYPKRQLLREGERTKDIAKLCNIAPAQVSRIKLNQTWTHVD
jgi:hypothetical protein